MAAKKLSPAQIKHLKEVYLSSQFVHRVWTVVEEDTLTLEDYATHIDPAFKKIVGNPVIIAKERKKDGKLFYKMEFTLEGDIKMEYDLSYENDFLEGDEIDLSTIMFCNEKFMDKEHGFCTGTIVE